MDKTQLVARYGEVVAADLIGRKIASGSWMEHPDFAGTPQAEAMRMYRCFDHLCETSEDTFELEANLCSTGDIDQKTAQGLCET